MTAVIPDPGGPAGTFAALEKLDAAQSSKHVFGEIARLVDRYQSLAADDDQRTQIVNLASLLRHTAACNAALAREIEHFESDAVTADAERFAALDRVAELEQQLADARGQRDTAKAVGGAL